MLPISASEKTTEMPNLLGASDLLDFKSKKINNKNFDYENELFTFNSSTPQLTQFQNNLVSEIPMKHLLITRVSVPPQYVYSILNQLIDLQKSEKYNFIKDKIFSAFSLPNDQSSIFFEGPTIDEIIQLFSIFKNVFSITEDDIIQFSDVSDIIHNVCNPIRTISFQIGNLIRISTPSFQNQVAQIIDFNPKDSQILIKYCPRIDYDLLIEKGIDSQIKLNNMMSQEYIAPLKLFEPEKLKSAIPSVDIKKKEIKLSWNDDPIIFDFWDNSFFLGPFQCKQMDASCLNITELHLESEEIELFKQGLTEIEKENETFIRNFQMAYDPSFETAVNDFELIDSSKDFQIEWNQNSESTQKTLNFSNNESNQNDQKSSKESSFLSSSSVNEDSQKSHKVHIEKISPTNSMNSKLQIKRLHSPTEKKPPEPLKAGDIIISRSPLENVRMKVRQVDNQRIVKADFLDMPIIGRMNQFSKVQMNSPFRSERSVYEINKQLSPQSSSSVKDIDDQISPRVNQLVIKSDSMNPEAETQCDIIRSSFFRIGDLVLTKNGEKQIILRFDESGYTYDLMDFNNNEITVNYSEILDTVPNSHYSIDHDGNSLFLFNSVNTDDGESGDIYAMHEGNVFVRISDGSNLFYNQNRLRLDKSCIFTSNNQMNSNSNYNNSYNNYNNNYNNSNNYDKSYNNSNNFDNGYNNSRNSGNNFNYSYNDGGNNHMERNSPESSRYSQSSHDDRKGYNNYGSSNRNQYNDNSSRSISQQSSQNMHTPPPTQSKSSSAEKEKPIWLVQNVIVTVSGKKEDAIITSAQNSDVSVQFIDSNTKMLIYGNHTFPLKDVKPKSFNVGDSVVLFDRGDQIIGKVTRLTAHHVYINASKKKKGRPDIVEGRIKDAFRYYDWDSLDDI